MAASGIQEIMGDLWLTPTAAPTIVCGMVLGGVLLLLLRAYDRGDGWRDVASKPGRARLPKGSFGWPFIGETFAFVKDPQTFISSHAKRYGRLFRCYLLTKGMFGTTPEFAKFVTSSTNLFTIRWPNFLIQILGPKAFLFQDGPLHLTMKRLIQKPMLPEALRSQVSVFETIVLKNMALWEEKGTVLGSEATHKITLETGIWLLIGLRDIDSTPEGKKMVESFLRMYKGATSVPLNLPGSYYNKGMKERVILTEYIKNVVRKRKEQKSSGSDVLGMILEGQKDPQAPQEVKDLDDLMIAGNLVVLWFASFDALAVTLVWILKFLNENPDVFRRIQAEQLEILKSKDVSDEGPRLCWDDIRKMVYTQQFFQEVQRILSIAPFMPREATQDVEFEEFLIPKGWAVRAVVSSIHHDPAIYPDPERFDPDRFNETPKPYTYMPFSAGIHMCPGTDYSKLVVFIFIHHLATTYIHESAGPDLGTDNLIFPRVTGGYPIGIRRRRA